MPFIHISFVDLRKGQGVQSSTSSLSGWLIAATLTKVVAGSFTFRTSPARPSKTKVMGFWDKGKDEKKMLIVREEVMEVDKRADQAAAGKKKGSADERNTQGTGIC